jgi:ankyrin repeat protein
MKKMNILFVLFSLIVVSTVYADINFKLIEAASNGNIEMVENLLYKGANINAKTEKGNTALIVAVENGQNDTVEFLLEEGANVNAKNNDGETALVRAAKRGETEIVNLLRRYGAVIENGNYVGIIKSSSEEQRAKLR